MSKREMTQVKCKQTGFTGYVDAKDFYNRMTNGINMVWVQESQRSESGKYCDIDDLKEINP